MKTATTVQENAEDILAEAQQINESRAAKEAEAVYEAEEAERQKLRKRIQVRRISKRKKFNSL